LIDRRSKNGFESEVVDAERCKPACALGSLDNVNAPARLPPPRAGRSTRRHDPVRSTWWIAIGLLAIAAVGLVLWFTAKGLQPWTPPIVIGAITTAVTITIIDSAVRREARQRIQPRVNDVLSNIGLGFQSLMLAVVVDYAGTHLDAFRPIPSDAVAMLDLWVSQVDAEDKQREAVNDANEPLLLVEGRQYADRLERARERDREVIEPDLIRAIDDLTTSVAQARVLFALGERGTGRVGPQEASRIVVNAAKAFAPALRRYAPKWVSVHTQLQEAGQEHSAQSRQRRDETPG
jgi:hypothetical protein